MHSSRRNDGRPSMIHMTACTLWAWTALTLPAHGASADARPQHYKVVVLPAPDPVEYPAGYLFYAPLNHRGTFAVAGYNAAETVSNSYTWTDGVTTEVENLSTNAQGPGSANYINWINQWGLSAGYATRTDAVSGKSTDNAVLWLPGGEIIDIAAEPGTQSHAVWVNNLGEASGWIENSTADACSFGTGEQTQGFIWQFGVLRHLGTLGGAASYGEFINDLGQVSGHAQTGTTPNSVTGCPPYDPFIWQHGRITDINPGNFGGAEGGTNFLSNRGAAVGFGTEPGETTSRAFLWKDGKLKDLTTLGSLGGGLNSAFNVNEREHVVGINGTADGSGLHAVLWRDDTFTDLGTLSGEDCSEPYRINNRDQIVGESYSCATYVGRAFLWEGGTLFDLNALIPADSGVQLQSAQWITDDGEIAASAVVTTGSDAGAQRAVLLIPDGACSDAELHAGASQASASRPTGAQPVRAATSARFAGNGQRLNAKWLRPFKPGALRDDTTRSN